MNEKVLGFRKENGRKQYPSDGLIKQGVRSNTVIGYLIEKDKLVPVVSVEWLEKWCKETNFCDWLDTQCNINQECVKDDLLFAAKKEASGARK